MVEKYNSNNTDREIDLLEIFYVLLEGKWIIISVTSFVSLIAVVYSLFLPNIYESRALLVPASSSNSISRSLQNYAGLAGIAGINLSSSGDESNSDQAMAKLKSLSFFENNILPNIFLPNLMAFKSWNNSTNVITYDDNIYNKNSNIWTRDPSPQQSFGVFVGQHLNISQDKTTGFITLKIKHQSPLIAKQWAKLLINEVNAFYRQKDKSESEKAVNFLNNKIAMTSLSEVKEAISELLQEETQKLTLIEANQFYVFDYIDPPAVMEHKSEPKRALICILSAFLGAIFSILYVIIKNYSFKKDVS